MNHPNPDALRRLLEEHLPPDELRRFVRERTSDDGFVTIDDAFFEHFNRRSPRNPVSQGERFQYTTGMVWDTPTELFFLAKLAVSLLVMFVFPLPLLLLGYRGWGAALMVTGLIAFVLSYRPYVKKFWHNRPAIQAYRNGQLRVRADMLLDSSADSRKAHELRQFFIQNGRSLSLGKAGTRASVDGAPLLYVEGDTPLTAPLIRSLGRGVSDAGRGYLVHDAPLEADVISMLDTMRSRGEPVVTLSTAVIRSALADGSAEGVLEELEQQALQQDYNLFLVRTALIDRRFFYGRGALQEELMHSLLRGEHVLLTGLRKVGKSSLLRMLRQDLAEHPVCHIDLQEFSPSNPAWPARLFATLLGCVDSWGQATFAEEWSPSRQDPTDATALAEALAERQALLHALGPARRLIIILDEVERMMPRPGQEHWASGYIEVSGALRALCEVRGQRWISIIAADLRPAVNRINLLPSGDTNPLFQFFLERPLPMLSREEVSELVVGISRPMGVREVDPSVIDGVWAQAGGHPFLTRQIAGHAFAQRATAERMTAADLEAGLDTMDTSYQLGGFIEASLWGQMTDQERAIVQAAVLQRPLPRHRAALAFLRSHGLLDGEHITVGAVSEWVADQLGADLTLEHAAPPSRPPLLPDLKPPTE